MLILLVRSEVEKKMMKIILPCAGFGLRVGKPESKEMLSDPEGQKPLIDFSLEIVKNRSWSAVIITRSEKRNLIDYLNQKKSLGYNIEIKIIEPSQEWPDTILKAKELWGFKNILILPDTRWTPLEAVDQMAEALERVKLVYAVFTLGEDKRFGFVRTVGNQLEIHEKPLHPQPDSVPWGLVGFHKDIGEEVFRAHLQSTLHQKPIGFSVAGEFVPLTSFYDLTR